MQLSHRADVVYIKQLLLLDSSLARTSPGKKGGCLQTSYPTAVQGLQLCASGFTLSNTALASY
jgi:hypothetical protein